MSQANHFNLAQIAFMWSQPVRNIWRVASAAIAAWFCVLVFFLTPSSAHFEDQSYLFLKLHGRTVEVRAEVTVADLNRALGLDIPLVGATSQDIDPVLSQIDRYMLNNIDISSARRSYTLSYESYDFLKVPFGQFLLIDYSLETLNSVPQSLDIRYTPTLELEESRKNLLVIEEDWRTGTFGNEASFALAFTSDKPEQTLDLSNSTILNGFLSAIKRGFDAGFNLRDYGVFLFALALLAAFPKPITSSQSGDRAADRSSAPRAIAARASVLVFPLVLGVGISLAMSGTSEIGIPVRLAETATAIAVGVAAVAAMFQSWRAQWGWLTLVAGLAFGFVFSERLLALGFFNHYVVLSCIGFSSGFAIAGMTMIALFVGLTRWMRTQIFSQFLLRLSTSALSIIALYWTVKRGFGIDFQLLGVVRGIWQ